MIVMGIDPGIGTTGLANVKDEKGKQTLLSSFAITTPIDKSHNLRLLMLYEKISLLIQSEKPDSASLEKLFFNTNITTAFEVGQARGVIILALTQAGIPIFEYTPIQVKQSLTGYGRAEKGQIQRMISAVLKLPKTLTPDDVADAAAIALTHCFSYRINQKMI
jgi:crossover junction endodeoxyribonuclease RuvC